MDGMADAPEAKRRWHRLTPDRLVLGLLAAEALLLLSGYFRWFAFNQHKGWTVLVDLAVVGLTLLLMLLWFAAALVFRCRFQYSLRSLMLLVLAVAVACSWLATEMQRARKQAEVMAAITGMGGNVACCQNSMSVIGEQPVEPEWLRGLLRDAFFLRAVTAYVNTDDMMPLLKDLPELRTLVIAGYFKGTHITSAGLAELRGLSQLTRLAFMDVNIPDSGLEPVSGLTQLQDLMFDGTDFSDIGIRHLRGLTDLRWLSLCYSRVTDSGLADLEQMTHLGALNLDGTAVSDAGLRRLTGLSQLRLLTLRGTHVTDEGVKELQRALPNCRIIRGRLPEKTS
jgi:hypothetical protein